jgi:hypothetical protein
MPRGEKRTGGRPKGAKDKKPRQRVATQAPGFGIVAELARTHSLPAIRKLAYLMEHAKQETLQFAAAVALLDRAWGRPPQAVQVSAQHTAQVTYHSSEEIRQVILQRGLAPLLGIPVGNGSDVVDADVVPIEDEDEPAT